MVASSCEATGRVIRILERARTQIVGTLKQGTHFLYVIPDDPRFPEDVYVPPAQDTGRPARAGDLKGGDRQMNCQIARAVLGGASGPQRDVVLINSSAALVAAGLACDFHEGMILSARSIDSGAALQKSEQLALFTQQVV